MNPYIVFSLGLFFGFYLGLFTVAMCVAEKEGDR